MASTSGAAPEADKIDFSKRELAEQYHSILGPVLFVPYAKFLSSRVAGLLQQQHANTNTHTPIQILETACGTGIVTAAMRDALQGLGVTFPPVHITATDLSGGMLHVAKSHLQPVAPALQCIQADMQALPYGDEIFDVIVCQFGLMFPPAKDQALKEAFRVLKHGGAFAVLVWDRIELNAVPNSAKTVFDEILQAGHAMSIPFSLHDPVSLQKLFLDAGFYVEASEKVVRSGIVASPSHVSTSFCTFLDGFPRTAHLRSSEPDTVARVHARLVEEIKSKVDSEGQASLSAWFYIVRKP